MRITSSVKILPTIYYLNNETQPSPGVIEIEGNDIVVDFNNAVLDGNIKGNMPDKFFGIAINIKAGKNITIKNLAAKGYKLALVANGVQGLTIEHCDFSYNYRQHLNSTQQKEDLSDWMSYHHNEKDEWQRYGAGIYLRDCNNANIHDNLVTGGQCALMLTNCNDGLIYNNDFSFNSGIGIGMYKSCRNKIMYNKLDFNVRGHSEGVYNRGQDSAAILVFEQCNRNVFAYNSATHSGDGFFLWAGQYSMDTGKGGCNDNIIFHNDFSYAPTNGVEVTFSRNKITENIIIGCDNGVWGGYSFDTWITHNQFSKNNTAIAIEHGQHNRIFVNSFERDKNGVKLWARKEQPADWGYAKYRDTRSIGTKIFANRFSEVQSAIQTTLSDSLKIGMNRYESTDSNTVVKEMISVIDTSITLIEMEELGTELTDIQRKVRSNTPPDIRQRNRNFSFAKYPDRAAIKMLEWGPFDFRSPLIWNTNPVSKSDTLQFEIIGPTGNWKVVGVKGVKLLTAAKGIVPATLSAIKTDKKGEEILIDLEYTGEKITTQFGKKIAAGKPYRFRFRDARVVADWSLHWYAFDSTNNPVLHPGQLALLEKTTPVQSESTTEINYAWWGGVGKEKKYPQFVTIGEADVDLLPGKYVFSVSWDDAVRLYIDGKLVLDEWNPSKYVFDESPSRQLQFNLGGKHHLRVEHVELGGFATLAVKLKKE